MIFKVNNKKVEVFMDNGLIFQVCKVREKGLVYVYFKRDTYMHLEMR